MKKFFISIMAAVLVMLAAAPANASIFMPSPQQGPVEQFISLFNRFFVLNYISEDLDYTKDKNKATVLEDLEGDLATQIVDLFDTYGRHTLTATEKVQLANFIDVLYSMSEGDNDSKTLARIKNQIYSLDTMNDLYAAILSDDETSASPTMLTYSYKDITVKYPAYYELSTDDTTYGVHLYLQHEDIIPNSVFMEIEKIDAEDFASLSKSALEKFLREECQNYYDRYIDSDYKISWKSDMSFYDDTNMAIIALKGIQYGYEFTGEILTLISGNYQFTAFITGSDDINEKEARKIFLSVLED